MKVPAPLPCRLLEVLSPLQTHMRARSGKPRVTGRGREGSEQMTRRFLCFVFSVTSQPGALWLLHRLLGPDCALGRVLVTLTQTFSFVN